MTVKTVELKDERFVILPESDFLELQKQIGQPVRETGNSSPAPRFANVTPLAVDGIPASALLLQDRR